MGFPGAYLFHFSPTGFESDTILSPMPRDFPRSPGSSFSYADGGSDVVSCGNARISFIEFGKVSLIGYSSYQRNHMHHLIITSYHLFDEKASIYDRVIDHFILYPY